MHQLTRRAASARARTMFLTAASCAITSVTLAAAPAAPATMPKMHDSHVVLMGSHEVPPVHTKASATSAIVIGTDLTVRGTVKTAGIKGTAAHIHLGAVGTNGPPVITLVKTSATQWSVPAGSSVTQAQYDSYLHGDLYVNVHSAAHPSGEIRLQLSK